MIDTVSVALAWISGASFLILSFYITYDSVARYTGLPFTGVSDEISAYVLAVAGTWSMAYALQVNGHVRIDLVISHLGEGLRRAADLLAAVATAVFALLLACYGWRQALETFSLGTTSITMLQAPLVVPQAMVALGFTLLTVQAALVSIKILIGAYRAPATPSI
tara:strand:+ start:16819 stop:17310 length:492 start_codon:yes stop_codon:yes gene_type:complete